MTNAITNEWLDVDDFKKEAFSSNSNSDLVGGCRTAVPGVFRDAVTTKIAKVVGGEVKGSDVRVYYPGGVVTDQQLVQHNNGHVIVVKGTGGVSKQSIEPKKKD